MIYADLSYVLPHLPLLLKVPGMLHGGIPGFCIIFVAGLSLRLVTTSAVIIRLDHSDNVLSRGLGVLPSLPPPIPGSSSSSTTTTSSSSSASTTFISSSSTTTSASTTFTIHVAGGPEIPISTQTWINASPSSTSAEHPSVSPTSTQRSTHTAAKRGSTKSIQIAVPLGVVGIILITVGLVILRRRQLTPAKDSESQTNQAPEAKELPTSFNLESPDAGSESVVHRASWAPYMNRVNSRHGLTPSNTVSTRQLYISNQVNRAREKVAELQAETSTLLRQSPHSSHHEGIPSSTGDVHSRGNDERLEQAIQQIESLTDRIRELERERRSSWALGISDEAPPGYIE